MIVANICLTDLPKDKIDTAKNGKKYINLVIDERREPDDRGNTHYVAINQTKEERDRKYQKQYVGNGKEYKFNNQQTNSSYQQPPQTSNVDETDDLPF